jgi:hypothetical protein
MAAALAGEPDAVLSHRSAAELWEIRTHQMEVVEVSGSERTTLSPHRARRTPEVSTGAG